MAGQTIVHSLCGCLFFPLSSNLNVLLSVPPLIKGQNVQKPPDVVCLKGVLILDVFKRIFLINSSSVSQAKCDQQISMCGRNHCAELGFGAGGER